MAQITSVTSEALQAQLRNLLPSQQGFGEDLQASNVIVPIIDLTNTAEGSSLRQDLQTALNLGGSTAFDVQNTTTTIVNTTGFWRVNFVSTVVMGASANGFNKISMTDGLTTKVVMLHEVDTGTSGTSSTTQGDLVFFVRAGESITVTSSGGDKIIGGSVRQIADINGNLTVPTGFTQE